LVLAVNGCKIEGNNPNKQRQIIDFIDFRKNLILLVASRQLPVAKNSRFSESLVISRESLVNSQMQSRVKSRESRVNGGIHL
jgi:hypothetical protein